MLSSKRRSLSAFVIAGLGALIGVGGLAACAGLLGIEDLTNAVDAGPDVGPDVSEAGPFVCTPAHPIERGDASDVDGGAAYVFAMKALVVGLEQGAQLEAVAWDLDDHCTCQDKVTPEACIRPTATAPETCDLKDGRDVAGNLSLRQATALVQGISDTKLAEQLAAGKFGAIVELRDWNGTADDPKVRVDFAPSYGTALTDDAGAPILQGNGFPKNAPLKHDGKDKWGFAPAFASGNGSSVDAAAHDDSAYVRGGTLVAHFSAVSVIVQFDVGNSNPLVFRVVEAVTTAKIGTGDAGTTELTDGRIGGRVLTADMMRSFGAWEDPLGGFICPNSSSFAYGAIQGAICKNRDIRGSAAEDHKALPCDAISFGIGFTAEPATIYGPVGYPYSTTDCFDGSVPTAAATGDPCK